MKELNNRQSDLDTRIKDSIKKSTDCLKEHMASFDEERNKLIADYEAELKPIKDEMEEMKAKEVSQDTIQNYFLNNSYYFFILIIIFLF